MRNFWLSLVTRCADLPLKGKPPHQGGHWLSVCGAIFETMESVMIGLRGCRIKAMGEERAWCIAELE